MYVPGSNVVPSDAYWRICMDDTSTANLRYALFSDETRRMLPDATMYRYTQNGSMLTLRPLAHGGVHLTVPCVPEDNYECALQRMAVLEQGDHQHLPDRLIEAYGTVEPDTYCMLSA